MQNIGHESGASDALGSFPTKDPSGSDSLESMESPAAATALLGIFDPMDTHPEAGISLETWTPQSLQVAPFAYDPYVLLVLHIRTNFRSPTLPGRQNPIFCK